MTTNFNAQLTVVEGAHSYLNQVFLLPHDKIRLIGRSSICHFRIDDPLASSLHIKIYCKNNVFYLKDLLSANGVFLDGTLINHKSLQPQEKIRIGKTVLEFDIHKDDQDYLTGEEKALELPFLEQPNEKHSKIAMKQKPLGRLITNIKDLNVLRLAIRYEIITHNDVERMLKKKTDNLCEMLIAEKIISKEKINDLITEHRYNKIFHKDTVFGKWAIYCEMAEEKQVSECLNWQEECYKKHKKIPRLSEMMVEKSYLTLQQNNKLVKTLKNRDL